MNLQFPQVHTDSSKKVYVSFYIDGKRYRLYNGKRINSSTDPNSYPIDQRIPIANILASEIHSFLLKGGVLRSYRSLKPVTGVLTDIEYLSWALKNKLEGDYSDKYKTMLGYCFKCLEQEFGSSKLSSEGLKNILSRYSRGTSYNTLKRHLNVLINEARSIGMSSSPMEGFKAKKTKAKLHKPYKDIRLILGELKSFNHNLYLCCLLTYGCLLRPHREIRELTWSDFSDDLKNIHLSGSRNKSGRNRIVPVPIYIRDVLVKGEPHHNIFSGNHKPLNQDYFKTLWSRFKRQSNTLEKGQTLYSFRHSGAIEIFKRTGSLTKLQKAMGHSSINVSLTYLRGLEIAELKEEDMPMV